VEAAPAQERKVTESAAIRVEAAEVRPSVAVLRLLRPGEVEPLRDANLGAALGGYVEDVRVKVGDRVKAGAVLARVDSAFHGANISLIEVEVADARRELARSKSLGKAAAGSMIDAAGSRLARAEAQLRIARIQAAKTLVKAPFAGVVAEVAVDEGEVAAPGQPVVRLVSADEVVISVSVADRDVGSLEVGGTATVSGGGSSSPLAGTIRLLEPVADPKTRSFEVEVVVDDPRGTLRPGMIASVDFQRTIATSALLLPQEFLVTRLQDNGVFVVDESSVARWRPLDLGAVLRDEVVVEGGLRSGETIVVVGHRGLAEGDVLLVERRGVCCTDGRVVFADQAGAP
jgi:multidrug efflux system membrane fusion protein